MNAAGEAAHAHPTYDFVVVGAGSSGAALAARLSEDSSVSVALLEAGGEDRSQNIHIPAAFSKTFKSHDDWNFETVPQPELSGRTVYWPRGKVLGGSSSINAMMWVTGFADDYERWAQLAGPEWGWDAVSRVLRRVSVSVEAARDPRAQTAEFLAAVVEAGYSVEEANLEAPDGFTQTMLTQENGSRSSTATAYLKPIRHRENLDVLIGSQATRVVFEGARAAGVEFVRDGRRQQVHARREIVLAAGAVNTPHLLMLSGIGDPHHLGRFGIEVVAASPEVGKNMRDHLASLLVVETDGKTLLDAESPGQIARYLTTKKGMLTSNVAEAYGFVRSSDALDAPDVEILFAPAAYVGEGLEGIPGHGLSVGAVVLQPKSRGEVALASADPLAKPLIEPRYLTDAEGADRAALEAGLRACERILDTPRFRRMRGDRFIAPVGGHHMSVEERIAASIALHAHTLYHPTSTARMGSDASSVVDPQLRVRGVEGLRVADASVMPEIIRGHTNAPSIVIGEKAAELLRAE